MLSKTHSAVLQKPTSYRCAHCKQTCNGQPEHLVVVSGEQLAMCCEGCSCAAQLLVDLYQCRITPQAVKQA
jgi:hypothetical protein